MSVKSPNWHTNPSVQVLLPHGGARCERDTDASRAK